VKLLSVVGNRPQFVKSAPLSVALRAAGVDEVVVHTGQHYDPELSRVFFDELGLDEPGYELDLQTADPEAITAAVERVVRAERPLLVLVFGDTNTTVAGARAARAAGVPVAHVEAGLRSADLEMPEERNRIEVDHMADLLLCPDERSATTLRTEGVAGAVHVVGDVMADAALRFAAVARERIAPEREPGTYVLATIHREANTAQPRLGRIADGLGRISEPVLLPAHPRTRAALAAAGLRLAEHVALLPPLGYLRFTALASRARVIVTDSGGVQKEAYWHGVPCVTVRPSTEWTDTVAVGANTLVDDDPERLAQAVAAARMPATRPVLYGDGHASERIADVLLATMRDL
jgi:UDP-N-acetylglucosamine 2-epimerase